MVDYKCGCWFCYNGGSRIGVVTAPSTYNNWYVMFEGGEWEIADNEAMWQAVSDASNGSDGSTADEAVKHLRVHSNH